MRTFVSTALLALFLAACGGGGDSSNSATQQSAAPSNDAQQQTTTSQDQTVAEPEPEVSLTTTAPFDDLDMVVGATRDTYSAFSYCGYVVPSTRHKGIVTSITDGDTIRVNDIPVRLDSIDAPELSQTYGQQSKANLSSLVLGKEVSVAYSKKDRYGRIVGTVLVVADCTNANLKQIQAGAAWFYTAYQCEISAAARHEYLNAQQAAQQVGAGLWSKPATAPWVYRNGTDPVPPTCRSDNPSWVVPNPVYPTLPTTPTDTPSPGTTPTPTNNCQLVWVNPYVRADGTKVAGYYRRKPGCP